MSEMTKEEMLSAYCLRDLCEIDVKSWPVENVNDLKRLFPKLVQALAARDATIAEKERTIAAFEMQCSTQVEELQKAEKRIAELEAEIKSLLPYCKRD